MHYMIPGDEVGALLSKLDDLTGVDRRRRLLLFALATVNCNLPSELDNALVEMGMGMVTPRVEPITQWEG